VDLIYLVRVDAANWQSKEAISRKKKLQSKEDILLPGEN
jgi:hypothetical protein